VSHTPPQRFSGTSPSSKTASGEYQTDTRPPGAGLVQPALEQ